MDVQSSVIANKALSSTYVSKQTRNSVGDKKRFNSLAATISSLQERLTNEEGIAKQDELEINSSRHRVALENLKAQQSLVNSEDAQDLLSSFTQQLEEHNSLDSVIQLDPNRVSNLIQ